MRKYGKIFIAYFPVFLIAGQVLINLMSFVFPSAYMEAGFYLNTFFGVNVWFAVMLVVMTQLFSFCNVSKWAARGELLFAINFLIIKEDNFYNIMFQIIVGFIAILLTVIYYTKKFPKCNLVVGGKFIKDSFKKGSCQKSIEHFDRQIMRSMLKDHHAERHH